MKRRACSHLPDEAFFSGAGFRLAGCVRWADALGDLGLGIGGGEVRKVLTGRCGFINEEAYRENNTPMVVNPRFPRIDGQFMKKRYI